MKKMLFLIGLGFLVMGVGYSAEAGTVKFPVEVSIDSSARYLTDTEMFVINLKSTPVTIAFAYYLNFASKNVLPSRNAVTSGRTNKFVEQQANLMG